MMKYDVAKRTVEPGNGSFMNQATWQFLLTVCHGTTVTRLTWTAGD